MKNIHTWHPAFAMQILSPPVGGVISQVFGWRSTFVPLACLCLATGLWLLFSMRHETHQYFVLKRIASADPDKARRYQEWNDIMAHPPRFEAPWMPLK
jgi:predicted MFS family arabinose efflux permease